MKNSYIILLMFLSLLGFGQVPEIREYKAIIYNNENDTARLEAMLLMSYAYIYVSPDSTFYWADQADSLAEEIGLSDFHVHALSVRGSANWALGRYDRALDHFFQAWRMYEEQGDILGQADCFGNIAIIYDIQGLSDRAIEYGRKDVRIRLMENESYGLANAYLNLGSFYLNAAETDSAQKYFVRCKSLSEEIDATSLSANASVNLANIMIYRGEQLSAIPLLEESAEIFQGEGNLHDLAETYTALAGCHITLGNTQAALDYIETGIDIAETLSANQLLMDAYELKMHADSANGDLAGVMEAHRRYTAYKDSVINAASTEKIADLQSAHDLELKEKETELELNTEISKILELFEPQLKRKEISVQRSVSPSLCTQMDGNALQLALRNVISNAIKYSPRGEEITISAHEDIEGVVLEIRDNGRGMGAEELKNLFKFGKDPRPGTENEKGTGLGLALSYLFLVKSKARIEAHADQGTAIKIILPHVKK